MAMMGTEISKQQLLQEIKNGRKPLKGASDEEDEHGLSSDGDEEDEHGLSSDSDEEDEHGFSSDDDDDDDGDEEEDEDDEGEEDGDGEDDAEDDEKPAKELAPDAAARVAQSRRREEQRLKSLQQDRDRFEKRISDLSSKFDEEKSANENRFEALKRRAEIDPIGAIEELRGSPLGEEELESTAKTAYSLAKSKDPAHREAAAQSMRERRLDAELRKTREELEKTKKEFGSELADFKRAREVEGYYQEVEEEIDEASPLVARLWKGGKGAAKARLGRLALDEYERTGEMPSAKELVTVYERTRRAELTSALAEVEALRAAGVEIAGSAKAKAKAPKKKLGGNSLTSSAGAGKNDDAGIDVASMSAEDKKALGRQLLKSRQSK